MKLSMKWAQCIKNYQKCTLGGPMMKQSVLPRHTNIITDKGFNLFGECAARCAHLFPQEEQCTPSSWGGSRMYTSSILMYTSSASSIANWQSIQTVKHSRHFRIISSKMKVSLPILSWWCFNCLQIQRIGMQYTDQLFLKIVP